MAREPGCPETSWPATAHLPGPARWPHRPGSAPLLAPGGKRGPALGLVVDTVGLKPWGSQSPFRAVVPAAEVQGSV